MPQIVCSHRTLLRRSIGAAGVIVSLLLLLGWDLSAQVRSGMPRAQKHESRREIDQLEDRWRDAVLKRDTATMASLLDDDFMAITPNGTFQTKDQTLANLRSGRWRIDSLDVSDRKVHFYGTTAIVTSLAEVRGTTSEGEVAGSFRYMRVYARNEQGVWKIVSFEASRISPLGEHN